jgi:DNA-binding CsgD family transcriptional regulator
VTHLEQALALFRAAGNLCGLGDTLSNLGIAASHRADHAAARGLHEEALATFRLAESSEGIADALNNLGNVAYDLSDTDRAIALWEESLALERIMDRKHGIAVSLYNLGVVAHDRNECARAAEMILESLALHRDLGMKAAVAWCLEALARLAAPVRAESAAKLLGLANDLLLEINVHMPPHERATHDESVAILRQALGEGRFASAWAAGSKMSLDEAVAAVEGLADVLIEKALRPAERQTRGAHGLTSRELDVLRLVSAGQSNQEISETLFISRATVARHIANIFGKFGVDSRGKAVIYAQQHDLL